MINGWNSANLDATESFRVISHCRVRVPGRVQHLRYGWFQIGADPMKKACTLHCRGIAGDDSVRPAGSARPVSEIP
jgi:hypothetical protein